MKSLCLTIARFSLCAWVGGAVLFVITGVREVTSSELDSTVKDILVPIRFNAYYLFGFCSVAIALLCSWGARSHPALSKWRSRFCMAILFVVLVLMAVDYFFIYSPLIEMITPPGQARTQQFIAHHHWSEGINGVDIGLCAVAAFLLAWPRRMGKT